jgi:hypothetical protein
MITPNTFALVLVEKDVVQQYTCDQNWPISKELVHRNGSKKSSETLSPTGLECAGHASRSGGRESPRASAHSVMSLVGLRSVVVSSTSAMLSGKIDLWVHNALRISLARLRLVHALCMMSPYHVARQCIIARKCLLLDA